MKIIILDFNTAKVHIYNYDNTMCEDDFFDSVGLVMNNCQWMIVNKENLSINWHN
jgi:hypothetical protein